MRFMFFSFLFSIFYQTNINYICNSPHSPQSKPNSTSIHKLSLLYYRYSTLALVNPITTTVNTTTTTTNSTSTHYHHQLNFTTCEYCELNHTRIENICVRVCFTTIFNENVLFLCYGAFVSFL